MEHMSKAIWSLNSSIGIQTKRTVLQLAIQNADSNSFEYYNIEDATTLDSAELVRQILFAFNAGVWFTLEDCRMSPYDNEEDEESEREFREMLRDQIHELTGMKPRIKYEKDDEAYVIHY